MTTAWERLLQEDTLEPGPTEPPVETTRAEDSAQADVPQVPLQIDSSTLAVVRNGITRYMAGAVALHPSDLNTLVGHLATSSDLNHLNLVGARIPYLFGVPVLPDSNLTRGSIGFLDASYRRIVAINAAGEFRGWRAQL